jgi:hypothetical protein
MLLLIALLLEAQRSKPTAETCLSNVSIHIQSFAICCAVSIASRSARGGD